MFITPREHHLGEPNVFSFQAKIIEIEPASQNKMKQTPLVLSVEGFPDKETCQAFNNQLSY